MSAALKAVVAARRAAYRSQSNSPTKPTKELPTQDDNRSPHQDYLPSFAHQLDPEIASPFGSPKPRSKTLEKPNMQDLQVEGIEMAQKPTDDIVKKSIENGRVNLSARTPSLEQVPGELLSLLADEPPKWFLDIPGDERGPWYAREELHTLQLANNELRDLNTRLAEFRGLKRLELSSNHITALPSTFFHLTNLTTLTLSNNSLTSVPTCLLALDGLVTLNMSNNKIQTLWDDQAVIKARGEREQWDKEQTDNDGFWARLSGSKNGNKGKEELNPQREVPMRGLRTLDLSNNRISNAALGLPDLAGKRSNESSSADFSPIRFPTGLKKLDLGNNHLRGPLSISAFSSLEGLEDLGLQGSGIADQVFSVQGADATGASAFSSLSVLDLSRCEIDDLAKIEAFFGSRRIQTLESDTSVDETGQTSDQETGPAKGITSHQLVRVSNRPSPSDVVKFTERNRSKALCVILEGNSLREEAFKQKRGGRSSVKKSALPAALFAQDPAIASMDASTPTAKSGPAKEDWELLAEAGLNTEAGRRKHRIEQSRKEREAVGSVQEVSAGEESSIRGRTGGGRVQDSVNKTRLSDWDREPSPSRPGRSSRERGTSQQRSMSDEALDKDTGGALATTKLSTKKKEALGQVPCKFFRSNGCSAGSSCPFAHTLPGDGQQKSVCQWFLKGNCRFGHKCALAHVLPGQPMSMDRKNKRAAQHGQPLPQMLASVGQAGGQQGQGKAGQQQQQSHDDAPQQQYGQMRARVTSFSGRDHDFPFGLPDDLQPISSPSSASRPNLDTFPGQIGGDSFRGSQQSRDSAATLPHHASLLGELAGSGPFNSAQRPLSAPRAPGSSLSAGLLMDRSGMSVDRIAVGSPPSSRAFGTSPFSHPGGHSLFFSGSQDSEGGAGPFARNNRDSPFGARSMGRMEDSATRNKWWNSLGGEGAEEELDENEDTAAEDFLPSSLSDLLTPAELERRCRNSRMSASLGGKEDRVTARSVPGQTGASLFDLNLRNGRLPVGAERNLREPARTSNISTGFLQRKAIGDSQSYQTFGEGRFSGLDGIALREADGVSQSPNSRAAMHHAPGQSLPQGLAAGLSRLHLMSGRGADASSPAPGGQPAGANAFAQQSHSSGLRVPGRIGDYDLGPTAPSSVLAHRSPLAIAVGGSGRMSGALSQSLANNNNGFGSPGAIGSGSPFSPPSSIGVNRRVSGTGEGLAIPSGESGGHAKLQPQSIGSFGARHGSYHGSHLGMHRVRVSSSAVAPHSPLTLPVMTREEDEEEAIFELE